MQQQGPQDTTMKQCPTSSRPLAAGGAWPAARLLGGTKALPVDGLAAASSLSFFCTAKAL